MWAKGTSVSGGLQCHAVPFHARRRDNHFVPAADCFPLGFLNRRVRCSDEPRLLFFFL